MTLIDRKTKLVCAMLVLTLVLPVSSAIAQVWPLPANTPNTEVPCTTAPWSCALPAPTTVGYPPVLSFAGRFLDAENALAYQFPLRTMWIRGVKFAPERNRVYAMYGSLIAAYDLDRFVSRLNARETLADAAGYGRWRAQGPNGSWGTNPERYLSWDAHFYAETAGWITPVNDGMDRLNDFDWDDRGNIYMAYSIFGWGIAKDPAPGGSGAAMASVHQEYPGLGGGILAAKVVSDYYAIVTGGSTEIWNTNNPAAPQRLRTLNVIATAIVKNAAGDRLAVHDYDARTVTIYRTSDFVNGGAAIRKFTSPGVYVQLASDGTNFYTINYRNEVYSITKFSPSGNDYVETLYPLSHQYVGFPSTLRANADVVVIGGQERGFDSTNPSNFRVYSMAGGTPQEINFDSPATGITGKRPFWAMYYSLAAPNRTKEAGGSTRFAGGYASPSYADFYAGVPIKYNGKTYLAVATRGLGDLWELRLGDTLTVTQTSPAPASTFYGDKVSFSAVLTSGTPLATLNWDFGGTSVTDNATPTYHFGGATRAQVDAGLTRLVKATTQTATPLASESITVTLKKPNVAFKLNGTSILFNSAGTATTPIKSSDSFADAADGTIDGHFVEWVRDSGKVNQETLLRKPDGTVPVGVCGQHTMKYVAHYGPYSPSLQSLTTDVAYSIDSLTYEVKPYTVAIQSPSSATLTDLNARFTALISASADANSANGANPMGATCDYTWSVTEADGVTPVASVTPKSGTNVTLADLSSTAGAFDVPRATFLTLGRKVKLVVTVKSIATGSPCEASAAQTAITAALNGPDPKLNTIPANKCKNIGDGCEVSMGSITNQPMTDWTCTWSVTGPASVAGASGPCTSTGTFRPAFAVTGDYVVRLDVSNGIGIAPQISTSAITIAAPLCAVAPSDANMNINYKALDNSCNGTGFCTPNADIEFSLSPFGWQPQGCEQYSWRFDGGSPVSETKPKRQFSAGNHTVALTVTNPVTGAAGSAQRTFVVGSPTPTPNPTPTPTPTPQPGSCGPMTNDSGYIGFVGQTSRCTAVSPQQCQVGENIDVVLYALNGYNFSCSAATFNWNFGDNTIVNGNQSMVHKYNGGGTFPISVTVNNNGGTFTFNETVRVQGGGGTGNCQTAPNNVNVAINYKAADNSCNNSGTCTANAPIEFSLSPYQWTPGNCETYAWTFDGGNPSSEVKPSRSFTPGTHTVALTVTNPTTGASGSSSRTFTVGGGSGGTPITSADFTFVVEGSKVTFTPFVLPANATGLTFSWNFGDETSTNTTTKDPVIHTYGGAGQFTATMVVNGTTTVSKPVTIGTSKGRASRR